jgi:AcrR family transcriptional regulator
MAERVSESEPRSQLAQRSAILQAAGELIAAEGYHGMSMRRLAKATGKSLAAVYNYYASKEEILFALQKEAFETLIAAAVGALRNVDDPVARLYVFISHHVHYFAAHPDVMRVLVHEAASLPPEKRATVRRLKERYFQIGREIAEALREQDAGRRHSRARARNLQSVRHAQLDLRLVRAGAPRHSTRRGAKHPSLRAGGHPGRPRPFPAAPEQHGHAPRVSRGSAAAGLRKPPRGDPMSGVADPAAAVLERCRALVEDLSLGAVHDWKRRNPEGLAVGYMPIYVPRPLLEERWMLRATSCGVPWSSGSYQP